MDPLDEDLALLSSLTDPRDRVRFTELMKTFHPRGKSVIRYLRQAPPSVASPAIRNAIRKDAPPSE